MWTPRPVRPFSTAGRVATSVLPSPVAISAILPSWSTIPPMSWTSKCRMPRRRRPISRTIAKTSGRISSRSVPPWIFCRSSSARRRKASSAQPPISASRAPMAATRGRIRLTSRSCLDPKTFRRTRSIMTRLLYSPGSSGTGGGAWDAELRSLPPRLGDELECVLEARVSDGFAAEHPGHLANPIVLDQDGDGRCGAPVVLPLLHAEMLVGVRGDLREVRDAENLVGPRDLTELLADGVCRLAADADVDLVEDQDRHRVGGRQHD